MCLKVYLTHIARVRPPETRDKLLNYIKLMNDTAADILDLPPEGDYGLIFHKLTKSAGMKLQLEF